MTWNCRCQLIAAFTDKDLEAQAEARMIAECQARMDEDEQEQALEAAGEASLQQLALVDEFLERSSGNETLEAWSESLEPPQPEEEEESWDEE